MSNYRYIIFYFLMFRHTLRICQVMKRKTIGNSPIALLKSDYKNLKFHKIWFIDSGVKKASSFMTCFVN